MKKYLYHDGRLVGFAEERQDPFGDRFLQIYDVGGRLIGISEERTDWLGSEYRRLYNEKGEPIGISWEKEAWLVRKSGGSRRGSGKVPGFGEPGAVSGPKRPGAGVVTAIRLAVSLLRG